MKKKVSFMLREDILSFYKMVAAITDLTYHDVLGVVLAMEYLRKGTYAERKKTATRRGD